MENLSIIIALVSLAAGVLQIFLFFKVWGMCNDIKSIKEKQQDESIHVDELIYLSKTNDPSFEAKLQRAIYNSLRTAYYERDTTHYAFTYQTWEKRCNCYNWAFPEALVALKKWNDFATMIHGKN